MKTQLSYCLALGSILITGLLNPLFAQSDYKKIHQEAIVADLHNDAVYRHLQGQNIETENRYGQFDLVKMRRGGIDVQFFALWPEPDKKSSLSMFAQTEQLLDSMLVIIKRHPELLQLATSPGKIAQIVAAGKTAACLGIEGGTAIANDLSKIDYFFERGVRYLGLTWNDSPDWASSAKDETIPGRSGKKGLTGFGVEVVKRMNQLGMMIDVSHAGEQTFYDVLNCSDKPVIASHSSVYAICPHYRNLKDDQIKALARTGGIVCINFYPGFLVRDFDEIYMNSRKQADAIQDSLKEAGSTDKFNRAVYIHSKIDQIYPGISTLVDHIEYVINLVGEDYVGLGSDFSGISIPPAGLEDVSKFPKITRELVNRGYSEATIKKILGGNFMRVFRENTIKN